MSPLPRPLHVCLAAALFLGGVSTSLARTFESAPDGYVETGVPAFSVIGPESIGLSAPATDLRRLPDGRLCAMAPGEFAFGDGIRWEVYRRSPTDGTGPHDSLQFLVGRDGTLYTGVRGGIGRVEFLPDRTWRFRTEAVLPDTWTQGHRVCSFATDTTAGWQWFWGSGPVFTWRPGETLRVAGQVNAIESVFSIGEKLYASDQSSGRTYSLANGSAELADFGMEGYVERAITQAVPLSEEATLIGTTQRGLVVRRGGQTVPFSSCSVTHGSHRIQDIALVDDRYVAVAIDGLGLYFFDRSGNLVQVLDRTLDHRLGTIRKIVPTHQGNVWALLTQGVTRVAFPHPISFYEPLIPSTIRLPKPFRFQGQLWLMNNGEAFRAVYDVDGRLVRFQGDTPKTYLTALVELDGSLLASGNDGIFQRTGEDGWIPVVEGLRSAHIHPLPAADGRWMFVAENEYGWLKRENNRFRAERFSLPTLGHVFDGFPDPEGGFWFELGSGRVGRAIPTLPVPVVEVFDQTRGLNDSWAQLFMVERVARINNEGSILRFDARDARFIPDAEILQRVPGLRLARGRPLEDHRGNLWISQGPFILRHPGGQTGTAPLVIPSAGLAPLYFASETNGNLWMTEMKRLGRLDPSITAPVAERPALQFTRIDFTDGTSSRPPESGDLGELSAESNSLRVHFMTPAAPFGQVVTFESKLEGSTNEWTSLGTLGSVSFNRLGHGAYQLLVRARSGEQVGEPASLRFSVLPPWYLTPWAWGAYALTLIGVILGAVRFATFLARREKERLAVQVEQRTAELNLANRELGRKMREIVEQNEKRRELEAQMAQIQRVESVGTLAGGIAHDFNNVLTGMLGYCELALLQLPPDSPAAEHLREIAASGMRAKDLISRILIYSRKADSQLRPINLAEPVREALRLLRSTIPDHIRIDEELESAEVLADATQIHQIVLNLCTNAVHAIGANAGIITVRLRRQREAVGAQSRAPVLPHAVLQVSDNGCGMSEETVARMFEPFFTTKPAGQGTGLGLSTVQGIVANHGGQIRATSRLGVGTTVEVQLPLAPRTSTPPLPVPPPPPTAAPAPAETVAGAGEILLVDDEVAVAKSTSAILRHAGYRIRTFNTPVDALAHARLHPREFSALITDLSMPQMTGIELARELIRIKPDLPVLLISGYSHPHLEGGGLPSSRTLLLGKPYRREELLQKVRDLLQPR